MTNGLCWFGTCPGTFWRLCRCLETDLRLIIPFLAVLIALPSAASELRQPVAAVYAIVGVHVVTEPGQRLENATVVVRDGVIEAVGIQINPPPDARIVEFDASEDQPPPTLYAGLIEPYLPIEMELDEDAERRPGRHPLLRAEFAFDETHWPAEQVAAYRRAGFTTALLAPTAGLFRGRSLLANLGDGGLASNLLRENVAQHAHLDERAPDGSYPQSLMGSVALFRQTLMDAGWQARARSAWRRQPGQTRPDWIAGIDELAPILSGEQPLIMVSKDPLESLRILDHVPEDVSLVLVGHGAEYRRLGDFKRKPLHILPLDFPDAPDIEDLQDRDVALEDLRHWKLAPENPFRLVEADVEVLLTAFQQSEPRDLFGAVARAIEHGLDADQALASLTTDAAKWLGIEDRAGRIQPGYMANLLLVQGDLFTDSPDLREVWVDGERLKLAAITPPEVDPAGTWGLTITLADGGVEAELVLSGSPTRMDGVLKAMGAEVALSEARVSGETLRIKLDSGAFGQPGTVSMNLDVDGNRASGSGSGPFGAFTVRARRSAGPESQEVQS